MTEIRIPYHLAIPSFICLTGILAILIMRKKLFITHRRNVLWTSLTIFFIIYLFIVGRAMYDDMYYDWDLKRYDLDQDGFYGGSEITPEQEAAFDRVMHDTGRNLSFITGFIFSFLISAVFGHSCFSGTDLKEKPHITAASRQPKNKFP